MEARAALFFGTSGRNLLGEDKGEEGDDYSQEEPDLLSDAEIDDNLNDVSNSQVSDDISSETDDKENDLMAMDV